MAVQATRMNHDNMLLRHAQHLHCMYCMQCVMLGTTTVRLLPAKSFPQPLHLIFIKSKQHCTTKGQHYSTLRRP